MMMVKPGQSRFFFHPAIAEQQTAPNEAHGEVFQPVVRGRNPVVQPAVMCCVPVFVFLLITNGQDIPFMLY